MDPHLRTVCLTAAVALGGLVAAAAPLPLQGTVAAPQVSTVVRDVSRGTSMRVIPIGTGAIGGTVTAADGGQPLAGARVVLSGMATITGGGGANANGSATGRPGGSPSLPVSGLAPGGRSGGLSLSRAVMTDTQGRFIFERLPAGQFTLNVQRDQYLSYTYGQPKPNRPGKPIVLADGQRVGVTVALQRGGVITGLVIGVDGAPLQNAQVAAMRYAYMGGIKRLVGSRSASTDDRGMYRLYGLEPGEYVVAVAATQSASVGGCCVGAESDAIERAIASATPGPARPGEPMTITVPVAQPTSQMMSAPPGYARTYYPNSASASAASRITVNAGEERSGIDITVQDVRAANISGVVVMPPGVSAGVQLSLTADDPNDVMMSQGTRANPNGQFQFYNIGPGQYTITAQTVPQMQFNVGPPIVAAGSPAPRQAPPALTDAEKLWGRATVTVDGPSTPPVSIALQPGRSISGRVIFETSSTTDPSRMRVLVSLQSAPAVMSTSFGPSPQAQVGADGRFALTGVGPGRYILRASANGVLMTRSAVVNGEDTLDFPMEFTAEKDVTDAVITITDQVTELAGTLTDASGQPAYDYTVILASADSRYWTPSSRRVLVGRLGPDGRYMFRSMPAGDYMLAAVSDLEPGVQYDPEFLKTLESASYHVTIVEGQKQSQDLRVRGGS